MFLKTRKELTKEFYKAQIEKETETIISLNVRKKKKKKLSQRTAIVNEKLRCS